MAPETLELLSRAFDPAVEPPGDATSERVLDAALALAAASGIQHLTMDDIAARAGVGRMTVYRRFGDKERLLDALAVREGRRCLAELDAISDPSAPIADQVADGFATSLRLAREHPLLNRLARVEPETVLASLTANGGALFAMSRAFVATRLRASQRLGVLGPLDVDAAAEVLVRLAFSFVLIQESVLPVDDEDRIRALARDLVAPVLGG
ncbi:MAG TPA: TetR/AcrR family transcriptional regulator [Solirubrobacterales bacterium]